MAASSSPETVRPQRSYDPFDPPGPREAGEEPIAMWLGAYALVKALALIALIAPFA